MLIVLVRSLDALFLVVKFVLFLLCVIGFAVLDYLVLGVGYGCLLLCDLVVYFAFAVVC